MPLTEGAAELVISTGQSSGERRGAKPLDLHEGIGDPRALRGCQRWPEHLRLVNLSTGELVPGRCRATNLCRYCQRLYVVETVEMLTLDAMEYAPTIWAVLTAREHLTRAQCRDHLRQLRKATKRSWSSIEWFVQVEFQRRGAIHLNLLVKGVPIDDLDALRRLLVDRWCARVDALPVAQWVERVDDGVGTVLYISKMLAHGLKAEQAPPIGWRGHRTSQTLGYLVRPASVMRDEARRALREKRRLHKLLEQLPADESVPAGFLEVALDWLREHDELGKWELVDAGISGVHVDRERARAARAPFSRTGLYA